MAAHGTEAARLALRAIYAEADREAAARDELVCELSGLCCRFREAGHELYLTRLEYEEMVARGGARSADPDRCPWLENGLCANREGRALACRTYFCSDEASARGDHRDRPRGHPAVPRGAGDPIRIQIAARAHELRRPDFV